MSEPAQPAVAPKKLGRRTPAFDKLARLYCWMEWCTFGPWLQRCRCSFLGEIGDCRRGIVLGDGDGRFTAQLLRINPAIEIDAVDASAAMLQSLKRRAAPHAARVHAHYADARTWQAPDPPCDLIATHFFLDCLTEAEVRALTQRLHGALSQSGYWLVSEFAIPEGAFGRWVARPVVWFLYRSFALLTGLTVRSVPDFAAALRAAGFTRRGRRSFLRGLLIAELWKKD